MTTPQEMYSRLLQELKKVDNAIKSSELCRQIFIEDRIDIINQIEELKMKHPELMEDK